MSDQAEMAMRGLEAFNRRGSEAFLRFLEEEAHPEFVFHIQEDLPNGGDWEGIEGTRSMLGHWLEAWEEFEVIANEVVEGTDGRVLVHAEQRAVAAGTGIELKGPFQYVWMVEDGKVREIQLFADPDQARRAAGLSD